MAYTQLHQALYGLLGKSTTKSSKLYRLAHNGLVETDLNNLNLTLVEILAFAMGSWRERDLNIDAVQKKIIEGGIVNYVSEVLADNVPKINQIKTISRGDALYDMFNGSHANLEGRLKRTKEDRLLELEADLISDTYKFVLESQKLSAPLNQEVKVLYFLPETKTFTPERELKMYAKRVSEMLEPYQLKSYRR